MQPLLHMINNPQQLHDQTEASHSQHKQSTLLICEVYIFDQHGFHDWCLLFPRLVGSVALWLVTLCNHPSNAGQGLGQGHVWSQLFGEDAVQWLDEPGAWWSPPCKVTCCQMKGGGNEDKIHIQQNYSNQGTGDQRRIHIKHNTMGPPFQDNP